MVETWIGSAVAACSLAHRGHELLLTTDVDDNPHQRLTVVPERNRNRHLRDAVDEVHGPVEGIDDPHPPPPPVGLPAAFLGEDRIVRKVGGDHIGDRDLGLTVDSGHRIDHAFHLGVEILVEAASDHLGSGAGGSHRDP